MMFAIDQGKLEALRLQLVERCSTALVQQLLDELRHRRVLRPTEVEHINESRIGRANQCRELIDLVIKKGDHSCNVLLKIIMEKDQALSQDLRITAPVKLPLEKKEQTSQEQNYKGKLIKHCTSSGLTYRFNNSGTGPSHDPRFTACVFVNEKKCGEGHDRTKRAAENLACKRAFLSLQASDVNYVGLFNDFCQRNKCLDFSFVDMRRGPSHMPEFFCHALIGQRKFPEATGNNKKEAKKYAAQLALKVLKSEYLGDLELQRIPGLDDL
ncbi:uncharacterized protein LOC130361062 [Hyla sarda]|uniref:uncharacterized protein LOC130361062 n=1 Tax=Hyla sarda TaxID=327740 RepID=UPI0024C2B601|nr:uncharacterized protein LOC130361062 [Hyla sarda]